MLLEGCSCIGPPTAAAAAADGCEFCGVVDGGMMRYTMYGVWYGTYSNKTAKYDCCSCHGGDAPRDLHRLVPVDRAPTVSLQLNTILFFSFLFFYRVERGFAL